MSKQCWPRLRCRRFLHLQSQQPHRHSHAAFRYRISRCQQAQRIGRAGGQAYIHFAGIPSALDFVKAGKDVIVLRTFSKAYGLAGIRCGFVIARPDLLEKVMAHGGWNFMPVTAVVAATASLKDPSLAAERKRINATVRQQTFEFFDRNGFTYIPSESNCFMVDTRRPGQQLRDAMANENVLVGRIWPIMPTWVRVTVGTQPEMERFQAAFLKVMKA